MFLFVSLFISFLDLGYRLLPDGWKSAPGQKRLLSRFKKFKSLEFKFGFGSFNRRGINTMAKSPRGSLAKIEHSTGQFYFQSPCLKQTWKNSNLKAVKLLILS